MDVVHGKDGLTFLEYVLAATNSQRKSHSYGREEKATITPSTFIQGRATRSSASLPDTHGAFSKTIVRT